MKNVIQLLSMLTCLLSFSISSTLYAQPFNDECVDAFDISAAFMGNCGDVTLNGPFDLTGSTPGVDDPPEPGEEGFCPGESDSNLFGDDSEIWENSIWYTWTVPDLYGDGSPVAYSIWTSDGSFGDDCGLNPNNILVGDADTQVAIYEGADCPNATTDECDHFAANEDLFTTPPWISGWLTLEFLPGETYYMGVDGWDGVEGEFCLTVTICGVTCGDEECAPVENYCSCTLDCPCNFGDIAPIQFIEDDPATPDDDSGFFFANGLQGNIFFCSEFVNGFAGDNIYLGFGAPNWMDCSGTPSTTIDLSLSVGQFASGAIDNGDGTVNIATGSLLYIKLSAADIATGSITISGAAPDGLGSLCEETITINFDDFPQATDPYCNITCLAGGIDPIFLDNDITVCEGQPFLINTDGFEDLTLPCNSDDGSSYVYGWRLLIDLYGTGDYVAINTWQILGPNAIIDPTTFFIDEFGYVPPYFTPGSPINPLVYGIPTLFQIQAAALCLNADGSIADGCTAANEGYDSSLITGIYLPADDPECLDAVEGCTDSAACNFNPNATVDDGSCALLDCAGDCGGSAVEGTPCTNADGEASVYEADCNCATNGPCEEEITGSISVPDPLCDVAGISLTITASDGTTITVTTGADGTFSVPGGPFPCGTYVATLVDVNQLPTCYTDAAGPTAPISFIVDGNPTTADGPVFAANPNIPTLSQWGLMVLALLLMSFGAVQLFTATKKLQFK